MSKQDPWLRKWGAGAMSHPSNPGCPPPTCVAHTRRPLWTLGTGRRRTQREESSSDRGGEMKSLRKKIKTFPGPAPLKGREKSVFVRCPVRSKVSKFGLCVILTGSLQNKSGVLHC